MTFTADNTEGQFTEAELETLNAAHAQLVGDFAGAYGDAEAAKTASDAVNNVWTEGATADEIVARVRANRA